MSDLRLFVGNREPSLSYTITSGGSAVDLSSGVSGVTFSMRLTGSSTLKVSAASASLVGDGSSGGVTYSWAEDDVDAAGDYLGWFTVNYSSGKTQDTPEFPIEFVAHAPYTGALCTLAEVRAYLGKPTGDRDQDDDLEQLILAVSNAIKRHTGRQFVAGSAGEVRRFSLERWYRRSHVRIDDLSTAPTAAVILDADGDTVQTLTPATAFDYEPLNRESDTLPITAIRFRPVAGVSVSPTYQLQLTGTWGWPAIPQEVRLAAIQQVRQYWRRDIVVGADSFADELAVGPTDSPMALSMGVKRLLYPYTRLAVA